MVIFTLACTNSPLPHSPPCFFPCGVSPHTTSSCIFRVCINIYLGYDLSMRISNSTTLNLTLFALVPTIRSQLPCTPHVILTELLLYTIAITLTLNLIQSYFVSGYTYDTPYFWQSDPWFILSVAFTVFTVVVIGILSLIHKYYWQPRYKEKVSGQNNY